MRLDRGVAPDKYYAGNLEPTLPGKQDATELLQASAPVTWTATWYSTRPNPAVDSGKWRPTLPIVPAKAAHCRAASVSRLPGLADVFWIGPDGAVVATWFNPAQNSVHWHTPFPITPPGAARANSPLAAVTRLNGLLDVY